MRLTADELQSLLKREEGLFLEFKSLWDQSGDRPRPRDRRQVRDEVAAHVAAFANAEGGTLILGVEDDGTATGHSYPEEAVAEFGRVPQSRLQPRLSVEMERLAVEGKEVLIFQVQAQPEAVMVTGNGFPLRVQDQVVKETQETINSRKQAVRRVGYEAVLRPEASLSDLNQDLASEFFSKTPHAKRPVVENLELYHLVARDGDRLRVTNAALLLFARDLGRWHPRAGIRFARVAGRERHHGGERNVSQLKRLDAPLARLLEEAHGFCAQHVRNSERLHDLFFKEYPEYPAFAWQEAIVNAVAHRDYSVQGLEVEVWFYEDRLEVISPGGLMPPVTVEALRSRRSVHVSRNPLVVRVLVDAGIMREEGEGIPRMIEEMEESFLRPPDFRDEQGVFQVTLCNTPILESGSPEWQGIVQRLPILTNQKRVLVGCPSGFTSGDYQRLNNVDRDQAYREIQDLVEQGIVVPPEKSGRGARYFVSPGLHKERLWLEERLPQLRAHFAVKSSLTNADYRATAGLPRGATVRELRRLVEAGVLAPRGAGRGAHYVRGRMLSGGE
ncbi:MAG: putative DNA binding domain-containing protein [Planctomycetes bacterium]|nr:putative DNA binding domain-containing protein [Planctomycetota bacterium]